MAREATGRNIVPQLGFASSLGITIERCTAALVEGRMTAGPGHADASDIRVHGGVLAGFAESLISMGASTGLAAGQVSVTADANAHFIALAGIGLLRCTARAISRSGESQIWQAQVFGENETLLAVITQTQRIAASASQHPVAPIALAFPAPAPPPASNAGTIPEQRLRQIVNAGSQVFGKTGYAGTSMRDVAAAAGMPIATMYQYVTGKEQLLLLIFEAYMAEISSALAQANDPSKTPRKRLHNCIAATLHLYDNYRRQIRLMYQEGRSLSPGNRERVRKLAHSTHKVWEGIVRDGIASGEFSCRDASVAASFIPLLCSIWVVRYSSVKGTTLDKLRESIVQLVEGGLHIDTLTPKKTKAAKS